jgi:hypothetical protein
VAAGCDPELAADGDPAEGEMAEGDAAAWLPHPARKLAPSAAAPSQAVTAASRRGKFMAAPRPGRAAA